MAEDQVRIAKDQLFAQAKKMLHNLDTKAVRLQSENQSCYEKSCINPTKEQTTLRIPPEDFSQTKADKESVFVIDSDEMQRKVQEYNSCVESCQSKLRKMRFECEFQTREFQLNLNECFWMCKNKETAQFTTQSECVARCFNVHSKMLERVELHLNNQFDN